ncbi:MAG: hypothetical protein J5953_02865 [Prevotella sp.]|jgi:hypothetical protein|nr:hypothetical protein [Prevotella sp.]
MIYRRRRGEDEDNGEDKYRMLRQILNILFMLGAVVGVIVYFYYGRDLGTIIILVSMAFKLAECVFRLLK